MLPLRLRCYKAAERTLPGQLEHLTEDSNSSSQDKWGDNCMWADLSFIGSE